LIGVVEHANRLIGFQVPETNEIVNKGGFKGAKAAAMSKNNKPIKNLTKKLFEEDKQSPIMEEEKRSFRGAGEDMSGGQPHSQQASRSG